MRNEIRIESSRIRSGREDKRERDQDLSSLSLFPPLLFFFLWSNRDSIFACEEIGKQGEGVFVYSEWGNDGMELNLFGIQSDNSIRVAQ